MIADFKSGGKNQMSCDNNELVFIEEEGHNGWAIARKTNSNKKGFIPISYYSYVKYDKEKNLYLPSKYDAYYKQTYWNCISCQVKISVFVCRYHCTECPTQESFNICHPCFIKKSEQQWRDEHENEFNHELQITAMRKHQGYMHWLTTGDSSADTLKRAFTNYSDRPCLGERIKNNFKGQKIIGKYKFQTFKEIWDQLQATACGLTKLNSKVHKKRGFVGICSINRTEWFVTDWACVYNGMVSVPLARTRFLVDDLSGGISTINNAECFAIVCSEEVTEKLIEACCQTPSVKYIIQMEPLSKKYSNETNAFLKKSKVQLMCLADLMKLGKKNIHDIVPIEPNDLRTIVYTSGSTGNPKGAMIMEDKYLKGILTEYWGYHPLVCSSFSPLDHPSDRNNVTTTIMNGGKIGIYSGDIGRIFEDLKLLEPCMLSSTPRLFNRLYKEYQQTLTLMKTSGQKFDEKEVLREFSTTFGRRIKGITVGGAPTAPEVVQFLRDCFTQCGVWNGYASTECGSIFLVSSSGDNDKHLFEGVKVKLVDVPDLNYFANGTPPRGEICVQSKDCIGGYYKDEEKTKELICEIDGELWYKTGDIGQLNENGRYTIIDRKKSFFKLAQGEFVAPEPLELLYLDSKFIDQIFVYGDSLATFVLAVVVPKMETVNLWAKSENIDLGYDLSKCETLKKKLIQEITDIGLEAKKPAYEIPFDIIIETEKFTSDNGKMTSSNKIARATLNKFYKKPMRKIYDDLEEKSSEDDIIQSIFSCLGMSTPNKESTFKQIGGDSLTASKVSTLLKQKLKVDLQASIFTNENMTMEDIIKLIKSSSNMEKKESNYKEDLKLIDQITLPNNKTIVKVEDVKNILLTGVTGFLGVFLLKELLSRHKNTKIHCLVRSKNNEIGIQRILQNVKKMNIELSKDDESRILVVPGDLSKENFGMEKQAFNGYQILIDVIYHNGSLVNSIYSYEDHKPANVFGTIEILKLATGFKLKPVHYISTIGVLVTDGFQTINEETQFPENHFELIRGGYEKSKWVAEQLIEKAGSKGVPVSIFRPGLISSESELGSSNTIDWFIRFLVGITKMKIVPEGKSSIDMSPVDYVSKAIVHITTTERENAFKLIKFHLVNLNESNFTIVELYNAIESYGINLEQLSPQKWFEKMNQELPKENILYPSLPMFVYGFPNMNEKLYDVSNTKKLLSGSNIECPKLSEKIVHNTLKWLENKI
eukprot:gene77-4326_t